MKKYKYLFGPVPSRRLGVSLGVDLVPHKTCSLNCIYCECNRTTNLTLERKEYIPTDQILSELSDFLSTSPELDYITFSGSGEPTLHSNIGKIVRFIKDNFPQYKIALITNGTLFSQQNLIDEIKSVDLILPSLDTASESVFQKINRPVHGLSIDKIIEGLVKLRTQFKGEIRLELFIIPGINDTDKEIDSLNKAINKIKPDIVQLNSMDRPGTESWITPASKKLLEDLSHKIDWNTEIIANFQKRDKINSYKMDIENAIYQTIVRRPCTLEDISTMLGIHINEINKYIESMLSHKRIIVEKMERGIFFRVSAEQENQ